MIKILDVICGALAVVSGLLLLFITFSIGYSIFARLVQIHSPIWVVQFNEYSLLWMTFLGTAWALSRDKHVSINMLVQRLGGRADKHLGLIHSLMGMGLCALLCWYGVFITSEHFARKVIDVQAVDMPKAYVLVIIPLGFLLLFMQFARKFVVWLHALRSGENQ